MCFFRKKVSVIYSATKTGVPLEKIRGKKGREAENKKEFDVGVNDLVVIKNPLEKSFSVVAEPPWEVVHLKNGAVHEAWAGQKKDFTNTDGSLHRVIFVNVKKPCQAMWGTSEKVKYQDAASKRIVEVGARGVIAFQIANSQKFVETVLGTRTSYTAEDLRGEMIAKIMSEFKDHLIDIIVNNALGYEEMDMMAKPIGDKMLPKLNASLAKYGVHIEEFIIQELIKPEDQRARLDKKLDRREAHEDELQESDYELEMLSKREQLQAQRQKIGMSSATHQLDIAKLAGKTAAEIERMGYDDAKGASYKELREMDREDVKVTGDAAAKVAEAAKSDDAVVIVNNSKAETGLCPNCDAEITANQIFCPTCRRRVI